MSKRVLTQADIEANPQLQLDGYKAGDTYEDGVQDTETEGTDKQEETNENATEETADDTGGGAPPPDKPRDESYDN